MKKNSKLDDILMLVWLVFLLGWVGSFIWLLTDFRNFTALIFMWGFVISMNSISFIRSLLK